METVSFFAALQPVFSRNFSILASEALTRIPGISTIHFFTHLEHHDDPLYLYDTQIAIIRLVSQYTSLSSHPIWVNLSLRSLLCMKYLRQLVGLLEDASLTHKIGIEITETFFCDDLDSIQIGLTFLYEACQKMAIPIILDDFGDGYSSLLLLNTIPFEYVKLSRSLIYTSQRNLRGQVLLDHLIQIIRHMNGKVVAEGIETYETYRFLYDLGCDAFQGNWLAKPATMPLAKAPHSVVSLSSDILNILRMMSWPQI